MTTEEKMLAMFGKVHGEVSRSCSLKVDEDDDGNPASISVMKDGQLCWTVSKTDLLFDYVTSRW